MSTLRGAANNPPGERHAIEMAASEPLMGLCHEWRIFYQICRDCQSEYFEAIRKTLYRTVTSTTYHRLQRVPVAGSGCVLYGFPRGRARPREEKCHGAALARSSSERIER